MHTTKEIYEQFIAILKEHEQKKISQDEMNSIIYEILKPYPAVA